MILATKCIFSVHEGVFEASRRPNSYGGSRRHIIRACEASLRRLETDWIYLYRLHRPDLLANIDESPGALSDLIRQCKVASNWLVHLPR